VALHKNCIDQRHLPLFLAFYLLLADIPVICTGLLRNCKASFKLCFLSCQWVPLYWRILHFSSLISYPRGQNFSGFGFPTLWWVVSLYKSAKFHLSLASSSGLANSEKHKNFHIYCVSGFSAIISSESCLAPSKPPIQIYFEIW
jgi:hypothetical protein